jgi:hypothetical protein
MSGFSTATFLFGNSVPWIGLLETDSIKSIAT